MAPVFQPIDTTQPVNVATGGPYPNLRMNDIRAPQPGPDVFNPAPASTAGVTDPVLAAYLDVAKTPATAGVATTSGPTTRVTTQASSGTPAKPGVFLAVLAVLAIGAFFLLKHKHNTGTGGAKHVE